VIALPVRSPIALLAAVVVGLAFVLGLAPAAGRVQAQGAGARVGLSIQGPGTSCEGSECVVELGRSFTLVVSVTQAPSPGYLGIGTQVLYKDLTYTPTDQPADEIVVNVDNFPGIAVRNPDATDGEVDHGMTAGTPPNFTTSQYVGPILELAMTCTSQYSRNDVELREYSLTNTLGTGFKLPNGDNVPAGNILLVHCGTPPAGSRGTATATPPPPGEGTPVSPNSPEGQATATAVAAATEAASDSATAIAIADGTATAEATESGDGGGGGSNTGLWIALGVIGGVAVILGGGYLGWRRFGAPGGSQEAAQGEGTDAGDASE
jgi:hypothetical protein